MYNLKKANAYECAIICNANYDVKIKHILIFYASNGYISYNSITDMKAICDTLMESQKARIPVKEHPGHMHWVPTQTHLLTCDWLLYILVMNQPLEAQLNHPLTGQTHYLIHPTVAL